MGHVIEDNLEPRFWEILTNLESNYQNGNKTSQELGFHQLGLYTVTPKLGVHQNWGFLAIFGQLPIQPATDWNAKKTCPSSLKIPSFVADNQVISPNLQPTVDEKNHHVDHVEYPLVNKQKAIEHGPFSSWIYPLIAW